MAGSTKSRKKTDKADAVTGKPNNTNEKSSTGNQPNMPLEDHLNRAEATIERNHAAMLDMHQQWRTQLLRMSYLIIIVTLHIAQTPSAACIKDIKQWNKLQSENDWTTIPGIEALKLVLHDSVVELMSIVCAAFLMRCLQLPAGNDFSTTPYRLSCVFIPMIVSLHFHRKAQVTEAESGSGGHAILTSCVIASSAYQKTDASVSLEDLRGPDNAEPVTRHFPVILVFHTIVSLSLWFMQYQNRQDDKNREMVQKLKKDLSDAKEDRKKR